MDWQLQRPAGVTVMRQGLERLRSAFDTVRRERPALLSSVLSGAAVLLLAVCIAGGWFLVSLRRGLPDADALGRIGEMDQATAVFDRNDRLAFTIFKEQRIDVPLTAISPNLTKAILAIEDQRFYAHGGFDIVRMASALLANIRRGRLAQGGRTMTQQLARQSFLTPDKTWRRKFQELILAARIEERYSKDQILEMYLNKVYFGDGLYGIEAAVRGYLGTHATDLTVADAALLAGLVKSPSSYAPTVSLDKAVARRNVVLKAMADAGAIDEATWQAAKATPPVLKDSLRADEPHGQYFKEQVRRELVEHLAQRSMVYTEYFARDTEPTESCDIHASHGIFGAIAAVFTGGNDGPPAPRVGEVGLPPATTVASIEARSGEGPPHVDAPRKRTRGFWSRVFGIGRAESNEDHREREARQR